MEMANKKIGFIGVGLMGHGMAKNLVEKGFPTRILGHKNRAPVEDLVKLGAKEAKDVAELVKSSEIVFLCVTGSPQVEDLVNRKGGILDSVAAGQIVVDTSTSQPGSTLKIAADFKAKGVRFVDAPLARTPVEAEQGRLNTMVGADDATFRELEPVLKAFCENIFHVGEIGAGHKIKLINNCAAIGQMALIAEALTACAKLGVDPKKYFALVSTGAANSGIFQMLAGKAV
jgi:3-hydroxyisobutyrate dehydrogenase-like beta-hydroxyacid dehydrogenase